VPGRRDRGFRPRRNWWRVASAGRRGQLHSLGYTILGRGERDRPERGGVRGDSRRDCRGGRLAGDGRDDGLWGETRRRGGVRRGPGGPSGWLGPLPDRARVTRTDPGGAVGLCHGLWRGRHDRDVHVFEPRVSGLDERAVVRGAWLPGEEDLGLGGFSSLSPVPGAYARFLGLTPQAL